MSNVQRPSLAQQVTFLHTADLAQTAVFYGQIFGLPLVLDQGVCRIYQVTETAFLGFCQHLEVPSPQGIILTLVSKRVDEWFAYLQQYPDVVVEKPPTLNEKFNIYHCFVRDPNGYLVEIQQFLDPDWPGVV